MIIDSETYLEHYGIKGMRWGVRRERRQQGLERAGIKGGPKISKVRAVARVGPVDLVKGRGITGGAARKAARVRGQMNRWDRGEATTLDTIKRIGSTRVQDLLPGTQKMLDKKTTVRADYAVVAATGAYFVGRMVLNQAVKKAQRGY